MRNDAEATKTEPTPPTPFTARRMVLAGGLAERVASALAQELPELTTRLAEPGELSAEDAAWADSYCGPSVPPNIAGSGVQWVHRTAAGVDNSVGALAHVTSSGRRLVLTRTVGQMPAAIGRYVLTYVLADLLHLGQYRAQQAERRWHPLPPAPTAGLQVAVLGTGAIGAGIAAALRTNGFRVLGINTRGTDRPGFDTVTSLPDAGPSLTRCTAVVCALPLTDATRGLIDRSVFEQLDGALFVNVGRGASVVPADLRRALDDGHVRHAVLDVVEREPLPAEDWRWSHPRVTVTPHVSGPTEVEDVVGALVEARTMLAEGRRPALAVDPARGY